VEVKSLIISWSAKCSQGFASRRLRLKRKSEALCPSVEAQVFALPDAQRGMRVHES